jgi:hypothetical protein
VHARSLQHTVKGYAYIGVTVLSCLSTIHLTPIDRVLPL